MSALNRREFVRVSAGAAAAAALAPSASSFAASAAAPRPTNMAFGLVTYMWAAEWDLPALIANCQKTKVLGVELRTTHKHGVEPSLTDAQQDTVVEELSGLLSVGT